MPRKSSSIWAISRRDNRKKEVGIMEEHGQFGRQMNKNTHFSEHPWNMGMSRYAKENPSPGHTTYLVNCPGRIPWASSTRILPSLYFYRHRHHHLPHHPIRNELSDLCWTMVTREGEAAHPSFMVLSSIRKYFFLVVTTWRAAFKGVVVT